MAKKENPLETPEIVAILYKAPAQWDQADIEKMVAYYRELRARLANERAAKAAKKALKEVTATEIGDVTF